MIKKILPFLVIIPVLLLGGFGCKGLSTAQQQATQPVTLEYWTVYDDVDALQANIDKFKAERPYLTINLRQLRPDEIYQRLVETLAEDKGPDIISVQNKYMHVYQTKLAAMPASVQDTTVTVTKNAIGGTDTTINTANVVLPNITQIDREYVQAVKSDVVIGGKIYGLPLSFDTMALYYNKDLLDKAGVAEPPKTWDDFRKAVLKITKIDKKTDTVLQSGAALGTAANIPGFDDLLYILFKQSNVSFVDQNGYAVFNASSVNEGSSPAMSVMNFYTDFANPTRDVYSWNEDKGSALDSFINGSLAFYFGYNFNYATIKARAPQLNFDVLPMLQLNPDQPVNAASYWLQTVTGKSKHQNEAWDLVNYLTHSKAVKDYLDTTARPSALRTYISGQLDNPVLFPFASQALVANSWYKGRNYDGAVKSLGDMTHQWLAPIPSSKDPLGWQQEILNRAASQMNQTFAQ
ncbi:MAG: extracellular solute-binding protein [Patescibacteria group bacterium]